MPSNSLLSDLKALLAAHEGNLTLQDVLEIQECVVTAFIDQREKEIHSQCSNGNCECDASDEEITVESDSEGDYIDKKGNIYDVKSRQLIGKKDLKTKEKVMYNIL